MNLSENFLNELFKLCFLKKDVYEVCRAHVKYEQIPSELRQYKKILKSIINNNQPSLPSIGVVSQQHIDDADVQEALNAIKEAEVVDKNQIINQLELFIKNQRFKILNERVVSLYGDPTEDRKDEAIKLQAEESVSIVNFTLKTSSGGFMKMFGDFKDQLKEKQLRHERGEDVTEKVPIGIDILDDMLEGGVDAGDTTLWIMRSGVGKSTILKWEGMYDCRLGYNVLHIQLEGGKQEAYDKYAQMWTKAKYSDIKYGNFTSLELERLDSYIEKMNRFDKELLIYSFEKFGQASMVDVRELIIDYQKIMGFFPDKVIIDSLDLIATGINKKIDNDPAYKKEKMDAVAQLMKDLCTEFYPMRLSTATQAADFPGWNDPDQYITRGNTEGNRTLVKPFSNVFTGNITREEKKAQLMRIFIDKFRNYDTKNDLVKIKTDYGNGKFYDRAKTLEMYKKNENL